MCSEREKRLVELLQGSFVTTTGDNKNNYHVTIRVHDLRQMQEIYRVLVSMDREHPRKPEE